LNLALILLLSVLTALALVVHELGHLAAARRCNVPASEVGLGLGPRLCGLRLGSITFSLRLLPLGSFVRLDGAKLAERSILQQLLVHLGGIAFNLIAALCAYRTLFGWINFLVALANLLPIYQHDGWKCGVVLMRALLKKKSPAVEWVFTFSGGFVSLVMVSGLLRVFGLK
jgi:membrane-associated protease RseP (regulator of RpoE activity)